MISILSTPFLGSFRLRHDSARVAALAVAGHAAPAKPRNAANAGQPRRVYSAMWRRFKDQLREFRSVAPGKRFREHYQRRQHSGVKVALVWRVLNLVLAVVAFVLGIVFSLIPGIPGFVFFFVSALLLAAESLQAAKGLDFLDAKMRHLWQQFRRRGAGICRMANN